MPVHTGRSATDPLSCDRRDARVGRPNVVTYVSLSFWDEDHVERTCAFGRHGAGVDSRVVEVPLVDDDAVLHLRQIKSLTRLRLLENPRHTQGNCRHWKKRCPSAASSSRRLPGEPAVDVPGVDRARTPASTGRDRLNESPGSGIS